MGIRVLGGEVVGRCELAGLSTPGLCNSKQYNLFPATFPGPHPVLNGEGKDGCDGVRNGVGGG